MKTIRSRRSGSGVSRSVLAIAAVHLPRGRRRSLRSTWRASQRSTSRPDAPPREYEVETGLAILAHTDPALVAMFDGIESTDGYGAAREGLGTGVRPVE